MSDIKSQPVAAAMARLNSAKDLEVYRRAYQLAMQIFEITKSFPPEEHYALTSQIRRSSRSVGLNLRGAWAKRRYETHFVNKLTECDGGNSETDSPLDFAQKCGYVSPEQHTLLAILSREIGRRIGSMIKNPVTFLISDP